MARRSKKTSGKRRRNPMTPAEDRAAIKSALERAGVKQAGLWATKLQKEQINAHEVEFRIDTGQLGKLVPQRQRANPKRKRRSRANPPHSYAALHGGKHHEKEHGPHGIQVNYLPPKPPFTLMGRFSLAGYVSDKGEGQGKAEYRHRFEGTLPLLCEDARGDLVLVRGRSKYRVEPRGIVG